MSKKKLFISCPMKGRTEENIKNTLNRLHKLAEVVFDQELEVIQSYIPGNAPDAANRPVWYLGESIKLLSEADYFVGVYTDYFKGCRIEQEVARFYGIPSYCIGLDKIAPDAHQIENANYAANCCHES